MPSHSVMSARQWQRRLWLLAGLGCRSWLGIHRGCGAGASVQLLHTTSQPSVVRSGQCCARPRTAPVPTHWPPSLPCSSCRCAALPAVVCWCCSMSVVKTYCGHGIGDLFHCAPNIPHYAHNKAVGVMKEGQVRGSACAWAGWVGQVDCCANNSWGNPSSEGGLLLQPQWARQVLKDLAKSAWKAKRLAAKLRGER
eukprot:GHRQ01018417.1.p1 GENE.GHRQ01018417.1~~GHRQ01018417.1.p1  ORF type:complete len:196 (-),score=44.30 GHRQ01018417.1:312-899(-)